MKRLIVTTLIILGTFCINCTGSKHFISDKTERDHIKKQYEVRTQLASNRKAPLFGVLEDKSLTTQQREAFMFLIAYMPLNDLADYTGEYFMDQINLAFKASETFKWGADIPEDIFRHFVLPVRVNNENLDTARVVIFNELKDRLINMDIEEAALEVNHWCHEKVNYKASDARTSSPLATMKTSFGRCGEESTYTVAAMRAVGIPARQVYTPRWAHTDDNHAWVEVYIDGNWKYLGACEPEPVLNKGWFDGPVKRAMMVHTNVIGHYQGNENLLSQNDLFSKINSLPSYTDTKEVYIKVLDNNKQPVKDAKVEFKIYNYSEFYPMVTKTTGSDGLASLLTGLGDLQVWAFKDELYGYGKLAVIDTDTLEITLGRSPGEEYMEIMEIIPPSAKEIEQIAIPDVERNNKRLAYEDSIRNAYMATFMSRKEAKDLAISLGLDTLRTAELLSKSFGNHKEISRYFKENFANPAMIDLLESIAEKDLRDTPADILTDHLKHTQADPGISNDVFKEGILSARIYLELIRPWRSFLWNQFDDEFREKAKGNYTIVNDWINENIQINSSDNYMGCSLSPIGVYNLRVADKLSRDIFFVAMCRTFGIPARIDYATRDPQVYKDGEWSNVSVNEDMASARSAVLELTNDGNNPIVPEYYKHFTIQRFDKGHFVTLDYEGSPQISAFPFSLNLEPGYYLLMTGHRREDGSVVTRSEYFNLADKQKVSKSVILQPLNQITENYGTLDLSLKITDLSGNTNTLSGLTNGKGMVIACIDPGSEPSRHLLTDIPGLSDEFNNWAGGFVFSVPGSTGLKSFNPERYKGLPKQSIFIIDQNDELLKALIGTMSLKTKPALPFVIYVNADGIISFNTAGYRIGTEENLLKAIRISQ